ncbi:unnamed protein product [Schistosoma rodhaini]|uniref:DUF4536 domain-containing protein n=1 Tax=Schistosoma rodhaini TaxID=6188 RepID=A0AA85F0M2_9TREM|nr:unnamed protein product [Schistosoma rodhaini]CAH8473235.1 unnamed protein product [Schistosoma rodhaini]
MNKSLGEGSDIDDSSHLRKPTTIDESCSSCRAVSSIVPLTLSAYIMYVCKGQASKYSGVKKVSYLTLCTSMSLGLLYIGGSQLFSR